MPVSTAACSALKHSYREILRGGRKGVHFVHLKGDEALIRGRLELRKGHYMPPTLLTSQIRTLEEPKDALIVGITGSADAVAAEILTGLRSLATAPQP